MARTIQDIINDLQRDTGRCANLIRAGNKAAATVALADCKALYREAYARYLGPEEQGLFTVERLNTISLGAAINNFSRILNVPEINLTNGQDRAPEVGDTPAHEPAAGGPRALDVGVTPTPGAVPGVGLQVASAAGAGDRALSVEVAPGASPALGVGGTARPAAEAGSSPSPAGLHEGGTQPGKADGLLNEIATTGDIIDVVTKKGKTKITIPRTEGMSHARRAEVAQNLVALAMIHGAYTTKKGDDGKKRPHFKIDTRDIVLRAAMEEQLDILGYTYDKVDSDKRNKDKGEYDNDYSSDMGGILPALSYLAGGFLFGGAGLIPDRLPSRYESAITNAKRIVRQNCAKSTPDYADAKAAGDKQKQNEILEDSKQQRAGFFDRFIAGADQVKPGDDKLPDDSKRRIVGNQRFLPNEADAREHFAQADRYGCRKAGDTRDGMKDYKYLKKNETPDERLDAIARKGVGEGNGWAKPDAIRAMDGAAFALNPADALEKMAGIATPRPTGPVALHEAPRGPGA